MRHRIFIILLSVLLAACSTPEVTEETPFRSDQFHLEVTLPPGWAGAEGPEYLARPFTWPGGVQQLGGRRLLGSRGHDGDECDVQPQECPWADP